MRHTIAKEQVKKLQVNEKQLDDLRKQHEHSLHRAEEAYSKALEVIPSGQIQTTYWVYI